MTDRIEPRYTLEEEKFWKAEVAAIAKPQRVPEWVKRMKKNAKDLTNRGTA